MDIFQPSHSAPLIIYLVSDHAKNVNGEVFRIVGDRLWVYRGWSTVNQIDNNGQTFTPEILIERVNSELLKNLPPKQKIARITREFLKSRKS